MQPGVYEFTGSHEIDLRGAVVELDDDGGLLAMKLPRPEVKKMIESGVLTPRSRASVRAVASPRRDPTRARREPA